MEDGPWQEAVEKRYPRSSIFYPRSKVPAKLGGGGCSGRDFDFLSRADSDTSSPTAELVVRMNIGNFFAELKRRNVYKVAVAYAVVSWLLIQIATQVFPFFEVPNWAIRLVVLVLVLGFPVALVTMSSQSFGQQQNKNSDVY